VTAPSPICQWCHQPVRGTPAQWDGRPQCPDAIACDRRRRKGPQHKQPKEA
jgi:hypothetical protein